MNEYDTRLMDIEAKMKDATPEAKAQLTKEWWDTAVEAFDTQVAGDVTLVDGRTVNIPKIRI